MKKLLFINVPYKINVIKFAYKADRSRIMDNSHGFRVFKRNTGSFLDA